MSIRVGLHDPLVCGAENGGAEVVDRSVDVDVAAERSRRRCRFAVPPRPCAPPASATSECGDGPATSPLPPRRSARTSPATSRGPRRRAALIRSTCASACCRPLDVGIRSRAELLLVLGGEQRVENGVLAAVPGVDHGPAVSGTAADFGGCRCLPALFGDQFDRGLEQSCDPISRGVAAGSGPGWGKAPLHIRRSTTNLVVYVKFVLMGGRSVTAATADVPSGIDDVTPQWLSAVLIARTVTDVRAEQIAQDSGFSSLLYRLHLTGADRVPRHSDRQAARPVGGAGAMEMLGGYRRELAFYRDVAGRAPMETPHVYAAADGGGHGRLRPAAGGPAALGQRRSPGRPVDGSGAGLHRRSWRGCTPGRPTPRMRLRWRSSRASTPRSRVTCWCPRSGRDGRSISTSRRCRFRPPSLNLPSGSPNARGRGTAGTDRTLDATARRHQGGQHVLRR